MNAARHRNSPILIALLLAFGMAATRLHVLAVPDASWAIFLLGGFYLRGALLFGAYLVEAALIDHLAIALEGVSDWCVTPAYVFLIPTCASLWFGGVWYARRHRLEWASLAPLFGAVFAGVAAAFLISNGSFYLLSGYFAEMSWTEYVSRVVKYYPRYALGTAAYVLAAGCLHLLVHAGARPPRAWSRGIQSER